MGRIIIFLYGLIAYLAFVGAFVYAVGFLANLVVPKGVDDGAMGPIGTAILINSSLLLLFAVQHTIMARPAFKAWWTRIVPRAAERSTFVLAASLILILLEWQWRPMPGMVWDVQAGWARGLLWAMYFVGPAIVLYSSFLIDHFDLFGLRQVWLHLRGTPYVHPHFIERSLYRVIRHPLMAGFLIMLWLTPTMSQGRLLFAALATAYIFFGIQMEERDLLRILGADYRAYRARTPMVLPLGRREVGEQDQRVAR